MLEYSRRMSVLKLKTERTMSLRLDEIIKPEFLVIQEIAKDASGRGKYLEMQSDYQQASCDVSNPAPTIILPWSPGL